MKRALSVLFVTIIALPSLGTLLGIEGGDAAAENRTLAEKPHWDGTWKSAARFPDAFSDWFEDHFAFRAPLVKWHSMIHLFGLHSSVSTAVLDGQDGWLFYADDAGMEDYIHAKPMTQGEMDNWRAALVRARDWLRARHVAFVFTVAPDKHVIYPEHMPDSLHQGSEPSRTDSLYAALAGTGVSAVDLRPGLLQAKTRERVYYLTDTHWNDRGAFIAYQQLIEAVQQQVPSTPPAWTRNDFTPVERVIEGKDLARMLGLTKVLHEVDLRLVPRRPRHARVLEPPGAEPTGELGRLVTEMPYANLPRAVIFRDSFTSRLVPFLSEHFSRAVYLWQNDFDANVIKVEHPDVVIQEIVGRHLYPFIPSPELVPQ